MGTKREVETPRRERGTQGQRGWKIAINTETLGDREGLTVRVRSTEDAGIHRVKEFGTEGQMAHTCHSSTREANGEG